MLEIKNEGRYVSVWKHNLPTNDSKNIENNILKIIYIKKQKINSIIYWCYLKPQCYLQPQLFWWKNSDHDTKNKKREFVTIANETCIPNDKNFVGKSELWKKWQKNPSLSYQDKFLGKANSSQF